MLIQGQQAPNASPQFGDKAPLGRSENYVSQKATESRTSLINISLKDTLKVPEALPDDLG